MKKREQLSRALDRLDEALDTYNTTPNSIIRDGVFQRFEFCTELAWKAAREYLLDQGLLIHPDCLAGYNERVLKQKEKQNGQE
mgnify:CR=1 FL=1